MHFWIASVAPEIRGANIMIGATASAVRERIRTRRERARFFGAELFADPAWDMLLELYASQIERRPISVSGLCECAGVAPTTALRWIGRMEVAGLIRRTPDRKDLRRSWVTLTDQAHIGMRRSFTQEVQAASEYEYCQAWQQVMKIADRLAYRTEGVTSHP